MSPVLFSTCWLTHPSNEFPFEHWKDSMVNTGCNGLSNRNSISSRLDRLQVIRLLIFLLQYSSRDRLIFFSSWDIMEPFTYFISYSAVFIAYCYYILRRNDMKYMNMADYMYLKILHRLLRKKNFDLDRFNALKNEIMIAEHDLQRLKDPLDRIVGSP